MNAEANSNNPLSDKTFNHQVTNHSDMSGPLLNETMEKDLEDAPKTTNEDPSDVLKKLINDPNFNEDLNKLLQHLSNLKAQREQYKAMLDQIAMKFEDLEGGKQAYEILLNDYIKENEDEESKIPDMQYGKDISNYLDKLNVQIDFLKLKIMEENSINEMNELPINEAENAIMSKDLSEMFIDEINKKKDEIYSTAELKTMKKVRPKWISVDYRGNKFEKKENVESLLDISRKSLEELQAKLGYFPQKIKDLEKENYRMMKLITKFNEIEAKNADTIKELNEKLKINDNKKEEMEKVLENLKEKQREVEEKTNELELKRKELETRENEINNQEKNIKSLIKNDLDFPHYDKASVKSITIDSSTRKMNKTPKDEIGEIDSKKLPLCSGCNIY